MKPSTTRGWRADRPQRPLPSAATPKPPARAARLALLTIPFLVLAAASTADARAIATVLPEDGLNLRAAPSTLYPVMTLIPGGTHIALTGDKNDDGWYPTVYKGMRGWISGEFVDVSGDAALVARAAAVRSGGVVLRHEPYEDAMHLTLIPAGSVLTVSTRTTSDGWVLAAHGGQTGWIAADQLQFETVPTTSMPAPSPRPAAAPATPSGGPVRATITYYHPSLEGGPMACGGRYRAEDPTIAAATSWPCGTRLRVCRNNNCVVVTVQDSGHLGPNWVDLSAAAFRQLAPLPEALVTGTVEVLAPGP